MWFQRVLLAVATTIFISTCQASVILRTSVGNVEAETSSGAGETGPSGVLAARIGTDMTGRTVIVMGFQQSDPGSDFCPCDSLHYVNIVLNDPRPMRWQDEQGQVHLVEPGNPYVDPPSGGAIIGIFGPQPGIDREPWWDSETTQNASNVGDFPGGGDEFDLDDIPQFAGDPELFTFADAPTGDPGLNFLTLLVCETDNIITPLGGVTWGFDSSGAPYMNDIFSGRVSNSLGGSRLVDTALNNSGFGAYSSSDVLHCVPEPTSLAIFSIGAVLLVACGRRRLKKTRLA